MAFKNLTGDPGWDVVSAPSDSNGNTELIFKNGQKVKYDPKRWKIIIKDNQLSLEEIDDEFVTLPT